MKKSLVVLGLFLSLNAYSQEYKSVIGLKSGSPGFLGANFKHYLGEYKFALDHSLGINFDRDNRLLSGETLLEYNSLFGENPGYNWYAGIGPTAQYYTKGSYLYERDNQSYNGFFLQGKAVLGVEFTSQRVPLNAAFELGPAFNFIPVTFFYVYFNVAVRYAFRREFKHN